MISQHTIIKRYTALAALALLFCFLYSGCGGSGDTVGTVTEPPPGVTTGRITGSVTGLVDLGAGASRAAGRTAAAQPASLAGLIVTIPETGATTTTDASGNFTISFVPTGKNTMIVVSDSTGTRVAKRLVHINTQQTSSVTLDVASTLQTMLAEKVATQLQTLVAAYAGMSVYDVLAEISDTQMDALLTAADINGDGSITLADFDTDGDGVLSSAEITAAAATPAVSTVVSQQAADAGVVTSVDGIVTDKNTGAPISGALVKIYATGFVDMVLTDATGKYAFYNVPAGTYYLISTKGGYTLESKTVTVN